MQKMLKIQRRKFLCRSLNRFLLLKKNQKFLRGYTGSRFRNALDHLRKKKRKKRFAFLQSLYGKNDSLLIDPPDFFHPGVKAENKENAAVLFKAIEKLPVNQKTAFVLNKIENLSYREIGEIMNSSESAVDSLLQRAKKNLQSTLKESLFVIGFINKNR